MCPHLREEKTEAQALEPPAKATWLRRGSAAPTCGQSPDSAAQSRSAPSFLPFALDGEEGQCCRPCPLPRVVLKFRGNRSQGCPLGKQTAKGSPSFMSHPLGLGDTAFSWSQEEVSYGHPAAFLELQDSEKVTSWKN